MAAVRTEANIAARKNKFARSPRDECAVAIIRQVLGTNVGPILLPPL